MVDSKKVGGGKVTEAKEGCNLLRAAILIAAETIEKNELKDGLPYVVPIPGSDKVCVLEIRDGDSFNGGTYLVEG